MATDGVKIIDSDTAHDIYSTFEQMYNKGASIEELMQQYEADKKTTRFLDEDYEVCITAYALAFWEIGALTASMLEEVKEVISRKATVIGWTEEVSPEAGKARQRELDKFLKKISKPRLRPKKRELEKKSTLSEYEKQLMDEAASNVEHGLYAEAEAIYKHLLQQNPNLHDARFGYILLLYEAPQHAANRPPYVRGKDLFASDRHIQYCRYIIANTRWADIEQNCRYMLTHRDTDRMTVSGRKKAKICDWYISTVKLMSNALMAQKKYEEAILFTEELIAFTLSRKEVTLGWVVNDYLDIYRCLLMMGDKQKIDSFIDEFLLLYPDGKKSLQHAKEFHEKYGIEPYLAV